MLTEIRNPATLDSIAAMIAAQPQDGLALAASSFRLSYGQLNERAAGLAQGLQLLGVGPDVPIAVYANRTPAGVLAALAVLKSGAGYVPLDPADPAERLAYILRDAQVPFVLAERGLADRLPKGRWRVIPLDEAPLVFSKPMEPLPAPGPGNLACIVYKSGPNGAPLGVEITHAGLLNLVRWHHRAFRVTSGDNASQLAGPAFDTALWEIWPYLTAGASLHFPDPGIARAARPLHEWLVTEYVTVAHVSAPMAEKLAALHWPPHTALRHILASGEALREYPPAGLPFKIVNHYGPLEATVVATSGVVKPHGNWMDRPSIGQPIDNVKVAILDEYMQPVRNGATGEVYIGGPCLARGYVNQPELTARHFVPDTTSSDPNARLFRTGDKARRFSDGQIEFAGQTGGHVFVRGVRIEPCEIERALNTHPLVESSKVVAREDVPGQRCLIAYIVPSGDTIPRDHEFAAWLEARLPAYMLPSAIVSLPEMPLKPDGQVDCAALPAPHAESGPVASATVEARLAHIIASLREAAGAKHDSNTLSTDHNPILAALVLDRVRHIFGVTLTPTQLFESPTVAGLAAVIERAGR